MTGIGTRWKLMGAAAELDPRKNLAPSDIEGIWARHRTQDGRRYRWTLHWYRLC